MTKIITVSAVVIAVMLAALLGLKLAGLFDRLSVPPLISRKTPSTVDSGWGGEKIAVSSVCEIAKALQSDDGKKVRIRAIMYLDKSRVELQDQECPKSRLGVDYDKNVVMDKNYRNLEVSFDPILLSKGRVFTEVEILGTVESPPKSTADNHSSLVLIHQVLYSKAIG
jgi:hypothetical protein